MILYSFTKKNYCRLHINKVSNTNITDNHIRILLGITGSNLWAGIIADRVVHIFIN